jgi:multiple sugar transport system ATP-binding protein
MATVTFEHATHFYPGARKPAVDNLDLEVHDGELMVLVGPSGCGKSTCLRMLAGLEKVDSGLIRIGERDVSKLEPKDRDVAMVFQSYALYPHMTVAQNMGFALEIAGKKRKEIAERVANAARILDLEPYLARKPRALSGGQLQRVALGRAIVRQPHVFLMDEPLSNLDAKLRVSTRVEITTLQRTLGVTTLYVTHDQVEAMTMGDRVAVLKDGVLQQVDAPWTLYQEPCNAFVAGFMGSPAMNLIQVEAGAGGLDLFGPAEETLKHRLPAVPRDLGPVIVGLRPEEIELVGAGRGLPMSVDVVEDLGPIAYLHGTAVIAGRVTPLVARIPGRHLPAAKETVYLGSKPGCVHLFSATDGTRLVAPEREILFVA